MIFFILLLWGMFGVSCQKSNLDVQKELDYVISQLDKSLMLANDPSKSPRNIPVDSINWNTVSIKEWTSGFFPGILWYAYDYTGDDKYKNKAELYSKALYPLLNHKAVNHDLGFMFYCSLGNGYRLTNDSCYKSHLLRAAYLLAELFNPVVGTINSWPSMCKENGWPHCTIIDNMINLELLFWAAKESNDKKLYNIAFLHAKKTMENHFRKDYSTPHVVVYDTISGNRINMLTHQGIAHESTWARGQAWAVYGFTMAYRETRYLPFLDVAVKAADWYLQHLPKDDVPYFDFDVNSTSSAPRDVSASAIVASALIELSTFMQNNNEALKYLNASKRILSSLSSEKFQSRNVNHAFLLHSTGHYPKGKEIDESIIYADYYYFEALLRLMNYKK